MSDGPPGGTGWDAPAGEPPAGAPPPSSGPFAPPDVPAGARCAVHADVSATHVCSRCGNFTCEACTGEGDLGAVLCPTCVDKAPTGIPWEQRKELGVFKALVQTWQQSVLTPSTFFRRRPMEKALWPVFAYGLVWRMIASFGALAYQLPGLAEQRRELEHNPIPIFREWTWLATPAFQLATVALTPVLYVISAYVMAGLWWLALKIVGGMNKSFDRLLRAQLYADGVNVFAAIPVVGAFVALAWSAVLQVIAMHRALETDLWRVIVAGVLLLTFGCILCFGTSFALVLAIMPTLGPQ